jgi:hypothetical protein
LNELIRIQPQLFSSFHYDALNEAERILSKNWLGEHARIMDTKQYKPQSWKLLMTIREVYNKANDIDLDNADSSKNSKPNPPDIFSFGE